MLSIIPTPLYFHEQAGLETRDNSFKAENVLSVTETVRGSECHDDIFRLSFYKDRPFCIV